MVYKVRRKKDDCIYALKRVETTDDALNEVRLLASLNHPNIIRFFDAFPYYNNKNKKIILSIILEYATRGDLAKLINKYKHYNRQIGESRIWKYCYQISSALNYLHEQGILHRDIKAANCFLTYNDVVKIGDLNISKFIKKDCLAHSKVGTPYYMCPEIWNNKPYHSKSDIWSMGCLLYELAALKVPFQSNNIKNLKNVINKAIYPKTPNMDYSFYLWKFISEMLEVNPTNRPSALNINLIASLKVDTPQINTHDPINLLNTIKMSPQIEQLTDRMPNSKYETYNSKKIITKPKSETKSTDTNKNKVACGQFNNKNKNKTKNNLKIIIIKHQIPNTPPINLGKIANVYKAAQKYIV